MLVILILMMKLSIIEKIELNMKKNSKKYTISKLLVNNTNVFLFSQNYLNSGLT
jgi:hypothetical protein